VVSLQNGIDSPKMLRDAFGAERVLGGVAHIATVIAGPGTIRHTGTLARLTIGAFGDPRHEKAASFVAAAKAAGIDILHSPDIARAIWEKFVFLAAFSAITAASRLPKGALWREAHSRALYETLVREAVAVARAEKIDLAADQVEKTVAQAASLPDGMKASMLHDLERGAKLELPWLSGAVVRMANAHGLGAPAHAAIVGLLQPFAQGTPHVHS
jgi:2-dehydropantoate 2-reductase